MAREKNIQMVHRFTENGKDKTSVTRFTTAKSAIKSAEFWKTSSIMVAKEISIIDSTTGETIWEYKA